MNNLKETLFREIDSIYQACKKQHLWDYVMFNEQINVGVLNKPQHSWLWMKQSLLSMNQYLLKETYSNPKVDAEI